MSRRALVGAVIAAGCATAAAIWGLPGRVRASGNIWHGDAIHATLETFIPVHNEVSFRYLLENRTDRDFRIADESDIRILGKSSSAADLSPELGRHVSGEFPLELPARSRTHFALVWTSEKEIEPDSVSDLVKKLNVKSFVVLDKVHRYQIEFPVSPHD